MDVIKIPPSDAIPYFSAPREVAITGPTLGIQVCQADPQRVLLLVANAGNAFAISTIPQTQFNTGITSSAASGFLVITYEDYGILVNQAWYLSNWSTGVITVITVDLLDRIRLGEDKVEGLSLLQGPSTPAKISVAPGVGGGKGLLDYWAKLVAKFGGKG